MHGPGATSGRVEIGGVAGATHVFEGMRSSNVVYRPTSAETGASDKIVRCFGICVIRQVLRYLHTAYIDPAIRYHRYYDIT